MYKKGMYTYHVLYEIHIILDMAFVIRLRLISNIYQMRTEGMIQPSTSVLVRFELT